MHAKPSEASPHAIKGKRRPKEYAHKMSRYPMLKQTWNLQMALSLKEKGEGKDGKWSSVRHGDAGRGNWRGTRKRRGRQPECQLPNEADNYRWTNPPSQEKAGLVVKLFPSSFIPYIFSPAAGALRAPFPARIGPRRDKGLKGGKM